jgi:hypothetical protein
MFGMRQQSIELDRYAVVEPCSLCRRRFYIERATDGARLLGGRVFASSLAAYMFVDAVERADDEPIRIVDADGHVILTTPGNTAGESGAAAVAGAAG